MTETKFKVAMGQMLVEGGALDSNLKRAKKMIRDAAAQDCKIIVLPECLDLGWTHPEARRLAQAIPGKYSDELCQAALESQIYVVAGLTERDDAIYNTALLISPEGKILSKHRKINTLTIEQDIYSTGTSLSVVKTPLGTIGINICADNYPSSLVLGHALARMGAQIILSPCAWAVEADHDNIKNPYGNPFGGNWTHAFTTLASLYDLTIIGVSNVGWINAGVWKGRKCIGCSLAVGPKGIILARCPYGEAAESLTVVSVELIPRTETGTAIADMLSRKGYKIGYDAT